MLSLDIEPDPFRLQEQQFRLVDQDCLTRLKRAFPIADFANFVLVARREGKNEIDAERFGEYVAILEERKQVKRVSVPIVGGKSRTEYQFRHDKIRDYYTHFALLGDDPAGKFALARDDRFAGVFEYLARELPQDSVVELKEFLLSAALDRSDHRLSDRFLQHLRWRSLLDRSDPAWLGSYDPPDARAALDEFGALGITRDQTEAKMREIRQTINSARATTRMLSASDAEVLDLCLTRLFVGFNAVVIPTEGGLPPVFDVPTIGQFALLSSAGSRATTDLARVGIMARADRVTVRKLLVINPEPDIEPSQRPWASVEEWSRQIASKDFIVAGTLQVHDLASKARSAGQPELFWNGLFRHGKLKRTRKGKSLQGTK